MRAIVDYATTHRPPTSKYPYVGHFSPSPTNEGAAPFVVLFASEGHGTVIWAAPGARWAVGTVHDDFGEAAFTRFDGQITLGND